VNSISLCLQYRFFSLNSNFHFKNDFPIYGNCFDLKLFLFSTGKIGLIPLLEPGINPIVPSLLARTLTSDTKAPDCAYSFNSGEFHTNWKTFYNHLHSNWSMTFKLWDKRCETWIITPFVLHKRIFLRARDRNESEVESLTLYESSTLVLTTRHWHDYRRNSYQAEWLSIKIKACNSIA